MRAQPRHHHTIEEYLYFERGAADKHEYYDGHIYAMAGGSIRHSLICANLIREVGLRLKGSHCRVYESNLRTTVLSSGLYTYPDVTVVCGKPELDPRDPDKFTIMNPSVIFEVLSPSTEENDREFKAINYWQLPSMRHYVLVYQKEPQVEMWTRRPDDSWSPVAITAGFERAIELAALGITLPLADIYDGVNFAEALPE
jgi:Uma2 family endonuclease